MIKIKPLYVIAVLLYAGISGAFGGQKMEAVTVTPAYAQPDKQLLPSGYFNKSEKVEIDSSLVDSMGVAWMRARNQNSLVWILASTLRPVSTDTLEAAQTGTVSPIDMARRNEALKANASWPRRMRKAIHNGRICLDMDSVQLVASWGKPRSISPAFAIGLGNHSIWYFGEAGDVPLVVFISNGRVIGWSSK